MKLKDRTKLINIREKTVGLLYPRTCPGCGGLISNVMIPENGAEWIGENEGNPYICRECYRQLDFAENEPRCLKCSRPIDDDSSDLCRDCREKERSFDRGVAAMMHNETARKIMYDLKYGNMKDNAEAAAFELVKRQGHNISLMDAQTIIPVPLHKQRQIERGYNQAALIAEKLSFFMELAGYGTIPVDNEYLIRRKSTERLKGMTGPERAENLNRAFETAGEGGRYKRVIVVDDIFTTGATLNECAKTLRQAGVDVVYFVTCTIGS